MTAKLTVSPSSMGPVKALMIKHILAEGLIMCCRPPVLPGSLIEVSRFHGVINHIAVTRGGMQAVHMQARQPALPGSLVEVSRFHGVINHIVVACGGLRTVDS